MDREHLAVVADGPAQEESPSGTTGRQAARTKPKRPLPTERMKIESQHAALRAMVRASLRGQVPVGAPQVAARLDVSPDTAGLVNNFFVEAGFIEKAGKGKYKPLPAAIEYEREFSLNQADAVKHLAAALAKTWYFEAVEPELVGVGSSYPWPLLVNVIADAAGVGGERKPQLDMVLQWLAYVGLVDVDEDGIVTLGRYGRPGDAATAKLNLSASSAEDPTGEDATPDATTGQGTTEDDAPTRGPRILGLKFEFSLTADDLAKLTPEQITATFEAVGKVMAIKAAMTQ